MGNYPHPIQSDGAMWFACPAFYMSAKEVYRHVMTRGLRISPAYALGFGTSGECLCGAYAARDDKMLIRKYDPWLAGYIDWLEDGVQRFGTAHAKRYPHWGSGPSMTELEAQRTLAEFFDMNPDLRRVGEWEKMGCGESCGRGDDEGGGGLLSDWDTLDEIARHLTVKARKEPEPAEAYCHGCGGRFPDLQTQRHHIRWRHRLAHLLRVQAGLFPARGEGGGPLSWEYAYDGPLANRYCPLCGTWQRLVVISWMHHWFRCCYCLLKLPVSKKNAAILGYRAYEAGRVPE